MKIVKAFFLIWLMLNTFAGTWALCVTGSLGIFLIWFVSIVAAAYNYYRVSAPLSEGIS